MIRFANSKDLKDLLEIENESFDDNSFAMSRQNFLYHIKKNPLFVYEKNGKIYGYVLLLLRSNSKKARIYSIAVDKSFRGLGIASKLLEKSFSHALNNDKKLIKLEVRIDNTNAIKIYEKYGFSHTKILKAYYPDKSDAFVMQKALLF
ncbi:MAG: ribosomal protein S18-alanine N-acetyltransferase [Campylobacteraceae bacterium]|jgi:ribosomal-protein-alanine N-acetyltransferase|nr:ribosomal protein S18-alanine N-acetyltransferase [Campylobacteraceae bacterium]